MITLRPLDYEGKPKEWADIKAFADATGRAEIGPDLELLHEMCQSYLAGYNAGLNPLGKPPSEGQDIERKRQPKARR